MIKVNNVRKLEILADNIREDIIKSLTLAGSGHSAGPLGMADVFTALYFNIMKHNSTNSQWKDRDRLILSNGHICPLLYATLAHAKYFPLSKLKTLRKLGTNLQGHPHRNTKLGIEASGGPLGQGTSIAAGIAYGAKMDKKKFKVFLSMGDGELNEGQCWESFMFAAKNKLNNLIGFVDRNHIQIDGRTDDVMPLENLENKFKAFNWNVISIDGHNMKQILKAFTTTHKSKPTVVICNTIPGKGVKFMEKKYEWHGKPPNKDEAKLALHQICEHESKLIGLNNNNLKKFMERCLE